MKIFILILTFLMPDNTWANVENFNDLIEENESAQRQLASTLEIAKASTNIESSEMAEKLPQSKIADAEFNILLKSK